MDENNRFSFNLPWGRRSFLRLDAKLCYYNSHLLNIHQEEVCCDYFRWHPRTCSQSQGESAGMKASRTEVAGVEAALLFFIHGWLKTFAR